MEAETAGTEITPTVARARALLGRFLADRSLRTYDAYLRDLEEFADYRGLRIEHAIADLLAGGRDRADGIALDYALALNRQGRATATVARRLSTLRSLVSAAHDAGDTSWRLSPVTDEDISRAAARRPLGDNPHYLFARDPSEVDRLDLQHYGLKEALKADFLAPISDPGRVLDAGAGTGQWGFDLLRQFPGCVVVGLDLLPSKPEQPAGYLFVKANLLQGLPFADGEFDFVHQRLLLLGVPLARWPDVVTELGRVARPGGWVELVEFPLELDGAGPATEQMQAYTRQLARSGGMDPHREVFDSLGSYLERAGLEDVTRRDVAIRIGTWGGQLGSLIATDIRAGSVRVFETMQQRNLISPDEAHETIQAAQREMEERQMSLHFAFAWGRKPS